MRAPTVTSAKFFAPAFTPLATCTLLLTLSLAAQAQTPAIRPH